ncbi:hypothetical protein U9M48_011988 [Paspalum notatum var. saurae]|uniref:Uncharacterized protein n=1 Tax=Paspalum notatum var. saurae TaxID=547442 RepID=A0AAQ3SWL8_PASNO
MDAIFMQEHKVTKTMLSEGILSDDFAPSRETKNKSKSADDNFGGDFEYTKKAKGKKYVPGKPLVHVCMENIGC